LPTSQQNATNSISVSCNHLGMLLNPKHGYHACTLTGHEETISSKKRPHPAS
jgi:hypothetical protein